MVKVKHTENEQLEAMVRWFRDEHPELADLLVFCPRVTTVALQRRGVYGCAELILLYPANHYSCLCIQVLNGTERNSDCHKRWRVLVEHTGCKCVTIRDLVSFTEAVSDYLRGTPYE